MREKSTYKCQNLNEPSITFPRERLFPRRTKVIFRYRCKVSEFPRDACRPHTSQDSHVDGRRMNRDSGQSWNHKLRRAVPSRLVKHFYDERLEVSQWGELFVRALRSSAQLRPEGEGIEKEREKEEESLPRARPQRARIRISLFVVLRPCESFARVPLRLRTSFRFPTCTRAVTKQKTARRIIAATLQLSV